MHDTFAGHTYIRFSVGQKKALDIFRASSKFSMPSAKRSKSARGRVPLADEIAATGPLRNRPVKRKSSTREDEDDFVETKASRKILKISQDLVTEDHEDTKPAISNPAFSIESGRGFEDDVHSDDGSDSEAWGDVEEEVEQAVSFEAYSRFPDC